MKRQIADFFSNTSHRDYLLCCGDAAELLKEFPDRAVNCCITSPPYWNQRKYTGESSLGNERHVDAYVQHLNEIFQQLKRVLREDGSLWLNLGSGFAGRAIESEEYQLRKDLTPD